MILILNLIFSTDVEALLDEIVAKEPLITPSKMEQVRKLVIRILYYHFSSLTFPIHYDLFMFIHAPYRVHAVRCIT